MRLVFTDHYDTIFDFDRTQGDTIDLSAIDANTIVDGDQAFTDEILTCSAATGTVMHGREVCPW